MCRTCTETQRLSKMLNVSITYPSLLLQLWHISVSTKFHSHFQTWCKSIGQIFQNKHRGSFYFFQVLNLFLFLFIQRIFWAKYFVWQGHFDKITEIAVTSELWSNTWWWTIRITAHAYLPTASWTGATVRS